MMKENGQPVYIGADPGNSGAFAVIGFTLDGGRNLDVFATQTVAGRTRGRDIVWAPSVDWLDDKAPTWLACHAVVELVGARPGQGASSGFKFGRGLGAIDGIMAQRRTPITHVTPGVWKKHFGLIGRDKDVSRARACELFPSYARLFARVKDDGVAEAALLARYGFDKGL